MERTLKNDIAGMAYILGLLGHLLKVEAVASPELAEHGLIVAHELLEELARESKR